MTTVVFLHGVGGVMPGWEDALRTRIEGLDAGVAREIRPVTVSFDDIIDRRGVIRRRPATHRAIPVMSSDDNDKARWAYYRRQQELRSGAWGSPGRVGEPWLRTPVMLPGEVMVRLPMWDMRQAGHYRHDDSVRAAVLDRISDAIAALDGDVIVFAHSLGSVIALDALHVRDISIGLLVTFGSPLGVRHFWGRTWESTRTFPYDRVGGWLNVINVRDPVPWKRGVSHRFPQAVDAYISAGQGMTGPNNYHDAATYARSGPVVSAVISQVNRNGSR